MPDNKGNQYLSNAVGSSKKTHRESGSQTDEDLGLGGHCCDASVELSEIKAKLDKILTVVGEIESIKLRLTELDDENKKLKEAMDDTAKEITNLKTIQVYTGSSMEANQKELESLTEEITNLKRRSIRMDTLGGKM